MSARLKKTVYSRKYLEVRPIGGIANLLFTTQNEVKSLCFSPKTTSFSIEDGGSLNYEHFFICIIGGRCIHRPPIAKSIICCLLSIICCLLSVIYYLSSPKIFPYTSLVSPINFAKFVSYGNTCTFG